MIERGKRIPRPHLMKRIADYYNKTVDELFFDNKRHNLCQKRMLEPCCPTPSQLAVDETCATLDKVG
jgi:transcriptional regulator with XRE-family HTH domain